MQATIQTLCSEQRREELMIGQQITVEQVPKKSGMFYHTYQHSFLGSRDIVFTADQLKFEEKREETQS
ncbi:MAG: hypothetical protein AAFW00_27665 [Bacteroidota bacterium]